MDRRTPFSEDESLAGSSIEPWLSDHAALRAAIRAGSVGFADGLREPQAAFALLRTERLAGAVLGRHGQVLAANSLFHRHLGPAVIDREAVATVQARRVTRLVFADDEEPRWAAAAYGPAVRGRDWAAPAELKAALALPEAAVIVLATIKGEADTALADACAAFGLTDLQSRVAQGLVRTGNVRDAARVAEVSYETARTVVGDAMRKVGAGKVTGFIERLVRLSFGVWPEGQEGADILGDAWGLSPRQAMLALRLSQGQTRAEAAAASGLSEATAKKELDVIFAAMGVHTAGALARRVTEARALSLLTDATHGEAQTGGDFVEPLRLVRRPDGGQVAFSDYGPRSGRPVLILHSSSASRPAPTPLVQALQARGWRPLSLDRPGFGLTDPVADRTAWQADPFDAACDDVALLLDVLRLPRIDIIARGGAQVAVALKRRRPELMGRVVLVNPDPPTRPDTSRPSVLSAVKEAFFRHPHLIEGLGRLFAAHTTPAGSWRILQRTLETSPLDVAVMRDARNFADYQRGFRMFSTGRIAGYAAEQSAMTRWDCPPLADAGHWRVVLGRQDPLHRHDDTLAYWSAALPGAGFETIDQAGRFVVFSHARAVVDALEAAPDPA